MEAVSQFTENNEIKRAIFLLEPATAAAIELGIVMPLKTCAHVLFRMMDIVSIKRGLPFHLCANGFLINKIGQSLIHHCDCIRKSESNISHNCQNILLLGVWIMVICLLYGFRLQWFKSFWGLNHENN